MMNPSHFLRISFILLPLSADFSRAESAAAVAVRMQSSISRGEAPSWWQPTLPEGIKRDVEAKSTRLAGQLELSDETQTKVVAALLVNHYSRVWAWHQQVDERLDAAWKEWDASRDNTQGKVKDELKALTVMTEKIDPIQAEFTPQIVGLLASLRKEIGEEKTFVLLDKITRSPGAKRTYDAYVSMVPEMTEGEKAVLWQRMVLAREESLGAWSDKQIVKIFKKFKLRNEFSLDYFGYGYQKRYQAWVAAGAKSQP